MWKLLSKATTLTVSSWPASGMMGSLHTQQRGANFLEKKKSKTKNVERYYSENKVGKNETEMDSLLVEILNTMDLVCCINSEWNAIKGLSTDNTAKALRMIWTTCSSKDSIQNWLKTDWAFFQCILLERNVHPWNDTTKIVTLLP